MKRSLTTGFLLIAIVFLPYWVYVPALLLTIILVSFYWEAIPLAFLIEGLYGSSTDLLLSPLVLGVFIATLILVPLRDKLRLHF